MLLRLDSLPVPNRIDAWYESRQRFGRRLAQKSACFYFYLKLYRDKTCINPIMMIVELVKSLIVVLVECERTHNDRQV